LEESELLVVDCPGDFIDLMYERVATRWRSSFITNLAAFQAAFFASLSA
jgi:hypothetical protein